MPYFCGVCGKEYKLIGARDNHLRREHNIDPYGEKGLKYCIKFTESEWKKIHKNLECILCDFKPKNWRGLGNHVAKTHNERMGRYLRQLRKHIDSQYMTKSGAESTNKDGDAV